MARINNIEIEKRFITNRNRQNKILNWGEGNNYPQYIRSVVDQSGRLKSATETWARFIRGLGFKDQTFYKTVVNRRGLTLDKLLRSLTLDFKDFRGFAIHLNYDMNGKPVELNYVPFETTRLAIPDENGAIHKIALHPDWAQLDPDKRFNAKDIDFIHVYNPANVLNEIQEVGGIENYKGQVFWYSADGWVYPTASFDEELESAITDIEIKMFMKTNIMTNFMASHMLVTGEVEDDDEREEFKETLKDFQGARKTSKILWMEKKTPEDILEIEKFDIQNHDKLFEATEKSVNERLRKLYNIPPVLVGDLVAGKLGTADEIQDAVTFYSAWTSDDRLIFEETFREIFQNWNTQVNPSGDYSIVPITNLMQRVA